jgi:hypothetical protein
MDSSLKPGHKGARRTGLIEVIGSAGCGRGSRALFVRRLKQDGDTVTAWPAFRNRAGCSTFRGNSLSIDGS